MVFFSSCNSVKFHAELLNYIDVPVMDIHGRQKQQRRTTTFFQVHHVYHCCNNDRMACMHACMPSLTDCAAGVCLCMHVCPAQS